VDEAIVCAGIFPQQALAYFQLCIFVLWAGIQCKGESVLMKRLFKYPGSKECIRPAVALLLLLFLIMPEAVAAEFKSQEDRSNWLMFYYRNPEPDRIPGLIKHLSDSGFLDNGKRLPPIFGFLSGVFQKNPGKVKNITAQLNSLKEQHLPVVIMGLWYANLPDSKKMAYALIERHPNLKPDFDFIYKGKPMDIESIPLEQGAWVLDALWGKFFATGDSAPVERIISALPWTDVKGDANRRLIGGAARWSLTINAKQYKRVLEICENQAKTQKGVIGEKLGKVIEEAKK
jgi:hypothetical protein